MDIVKETVSKIKRLEIQGASSVALSSIKAMKELIKDSKAKNKEALLKEVLKAKKMFFDSRPNEPMMRNALRFMVEKLRSYEGNVNEVKIKSDEAISKWQELMQNARKETSLICSNKIPKNSVILTHCHSSTVVDSLIRAKDKNINIICTESRPLFQGRITARELVNNKIPTTMIVDSSVPNYIKKADMILLGADVILSEGDVINKVGSNMISILAEKYDVPLFIVANFWKFDPKTSRGFIEKIELRKPDEVWKNPPKNLKIINPAFDLIDNDRINGIISQEGILPPELMYNMLLKRQSWMFEDVIYDETKS